MPATKFGAVTSLSGAFAVHGRKYKRSPWGGIRGFTQFKHNMQKLALIGDSQVLIDGFTGIAREIKADMDVKTRSKFAPVTAKYIRWKVAQIKKRKSGSTHFTSLRDRGIAANPFKAKGKSKSFVAVDYRYAPHAHFFEAGTQERYTKADAYRGKIKKFSFFRSTVNSWKSSGRFVSRVERVVRTAVDIKAKGMIT